MKNISNSIVNKAKKLRNIMTEAEIRLWSLLRYKQLGGYKFRRQHPVGPYVVDFICLQKSLIIEIDGRQHNVDSDYDVQRTKYLESLGFKIIRFWNNDVLKNIDGVLDVICCELGLDD